MIPITILLKPQYLHIPDGFLTLAISLLFWALTIPMLVIAMRKTQQEFGERLIPLMGVVAAFVFAAQMLNFPVLGGTSGHFLGGAFAAILLGPWAGMVVMTAVISVQALLFQDGGLVVLGANIFNMGILTTLIGYSVYFLFQRWGKKGIFIGAGIGAWVSLMGAALFTALQLWLSGTATAAIVFPSILIVHLLIGVGETIITVAALAFVMRVKPEIVSSDKKMPVGRGWVVIGLGLVLLVVVLAPLASTSPDGLETVAGNLGFGALAQNSPINILADYTMPFSDSPLSVIASGIIGVSALAAIFFGTRFVLQLRDKKE